MTLRVGWLGAGLIATFHSKMLRASGADVTWAGVYDPDGERAAAFARSSGASVCASPEEVLAGCDYAYICTWTAAHLPLVEAAVAAGVPVFCEKPLAPDLATARTLVARLDASGLPNQVGLILRRSPAFTLARELVHEPEAGRIVSFVFRDDQFIPTRGHYASTWRGDRTLAGAGTLIEHSIHDIDMIESTMGPVAAVRADQAFFHAIDGIEDVVATTITLESGAVGTLTSIWHDIDARPSLRRLEIFCERRLVTIEGDWFGPVSWTDDDGSERQLEMSELIEECERRGLDVANPDGAFAEAVARGESGFPDVHIALRAHEVVDAVYRSCVSGQRETCSPAE